MSHQNDRALFFFFVLEYGLGDFGTMLAGFLVGDLFQFALSALFFLHFAFFVALHFLLPLLKCRRHSFSLRRMRAGAAGPYSNEQLRKSSSWRNLPARLAGLTRGFAIVLVRETVSAATLAAATTSAALTSAIAAAEIVSRAARRAALAARTRFVHLQISAAGFLAIESGNGLGSFVIIGHFNESKTSSTTGFAVHGHVHAGDLTERLEQGAEIAFGSLKIHVSDEKALHVSS
jgi:hypothetical protein